MDRDIWYLCLPLPQPNFELLYIEGHHLSFHDEGGCHGILVAFLSLLELLRNEPELQLLLLDDLSHHNAHVVRIKGITSLR